MLYSVVMVQRLETGTSCGKSSLLSSSVKTTIIAPLSCSSCMHTDFCNDSGGEAKMLTTNEDSDTKARL